MRTSWQRFIASSYAAAASRSCSRKPKFTNNTVTFRKSAPQYSCQKLTCETRRVRRDTETMLVCFPHLIRAVGVNPGNDRASHVASQTSFNFCEGYGEPRDHSDRSHKNQQGTRHTRTRPHSFQVQLLQNAGDTNLLQVLRARLRSRKASSDRDKRRSLGKKEATRTPRRMKPSCSMSRASKNSLINVHAWGDTMISPPCSAQCSAANA
jgi:hypothetical protein